MTLAWLPSVAGAVFALAWLAGLWYAAPLVDGGERDLADRLRNTILLGVAIPFVLGFFGVLWGPSAFATLAVVGIARRRSSCTVGPKIDAELVAILAASLVLLWPQLCRPILDGDTLLYHLPNAAAWAQAHTIWQTNALEWSYPGASELFAAPFVAFGAWWSLPLCGALPALLVTARIAIWGRELGASALTAGLCALAFLATPIAAYEMGTLQNDLWLAAFFLESLFVLRSRDGRGAVALLCLLKPVGFVYAFVAIGARRAYDRRLLWAFIPLAVWLVRDAVLLPHALVAVDSVPHYWPTTIAANLGPAFEVLGSGLSYAGWATPIFIGLPLAGLALPETRVAAIAGSIAVLVYLVLPLSYFGSVNNVAAGSSFRYALPAMACGALVLCALCVRFGRPAIAVAASIAAGGAFAVIALFWNDGWTRAALGLAPLGIVAVLRDRRRRRWVASLIGILIVLSAAPIAAIRAPGFFADWMRGPDGQPTGAFVWIAAHRPERVAAWAVRAGSILLQSPSTRTVEATDVTPCATATRFGALLFLGTDRDQPADLQARRRSIAGTCGEVVYEDSAALIVRPRDASFAPSSKSRNQ